MNIDFAEGDNQAFMNPDFTENQNQALRRKYDQSSSGANCFQEFYDSAQRSSYDGVVMVRWCSMWLGIETDGYTHS